LKERPSGRMGRIASTQLQALPAPFIPGARSGQPRRQGQREAGMDDKTKEHALEYALILGVGAVLLVIVFLNIHSHFIA